MLRLAGAISAAIALLHVAVILIGAPAYRYFGAGDEMARLAEQGSRTPAVITAVIAVLFALWALYAFSGAGVVRRLPLLKTGLVTIGVIYSLRGLLLGPQAVAVFSGHAPFIAPRQLVFSAVSLATGLCYLLGAARAWRRLSAQAVQVA
jgi:hypothetical protein